MVGIMVWVFTALLAIALIGLAVLAAMVVINDRKAHKSMSLASIISDIEAKVGELKTAAQTADTDVVDEYAKIKANPEANAVLTTLQSVAQAELPAGVISAAGEVFKALTDFAKAKPATETPATPAASPAPASAVSAPVATPAAEVNPGASLMGIKQP